MIAIDDICRIQAILEGNRAGIRTQPGAVLKNAATGEIVYTPPRHIDEIRKLLDNPKIIINDDKSWKDVGSLVKMAIIHYQFESIHQFFDGNGRPGRILNVLYLVLKGLPDAPILQLSKYIISRKSDFCRNLQRVRTNGEPEGFVLFRSDAVIETAILTDKTAMAIDMGFAQMPGRNQGRQQIQFLFRGLKNALFLFPYTRIARLQKPGAAEQPRQLI